MLSNLAVKRCTNARFTVVALQQLGLQLLTDCCIVSLYMQVGYGAPDVFFGRCWSVMFVITCQACCGLLIDALLIGLLFAR
jgi:hypothetical protein